MSDHQSWYAYSTERVRQSRDDLLAEDIESRRIMQQLRPILSRRHLHLGVAWKGMRRRIWMYVLNCTLGWSSSRIARAMRCHRTLVQKHVASIEFDRDNPTFDAFLTAVEDRVRYTTECQPQ